MIYEYLMEKFIEWANTQSDIRAAIVVGSQARQDHPADEWADLDIIVYTTKPERYFEQTDWMANVGHVWVKMRSRTANNEPEWLTTFEGGLDVDFVFNSYQQMNWGTRALLLLQKFPWLIRFFPRGMADKVEHEVPLGAQLFDRGVRVLLDRDGLIARMRRVLNQPPSPEPPTETEFLELVSHFWCIAGRKAKKICRGELYVAQSWSLNRLMLPMIEWHARATQGWEHDVWHDGRFLEEWTHPRVLEEFEKTFARYDRDEMCRSLLATMDLFRWLATETAQHLGYPYPTTTDEHITELVKGFFQEKLLVPPPETPQFLLAREQLDRTRLAFLDLLESILDSDWDRPLQGEGWTVKQEMVHVVQVMNALRGAINRAGTGRGPSFLSAVPAFVRNIINGRLVVPFMARRATRESVASAYQEAHDALLATLAELPEEAWSKGIPFPRRYRTVEALAYRPVEHFDEHAFHIRRVLMIGDSQPENSE